MNSITLRLILLLLPAALAAQEQDLYLDGEARFQQKAWDAALDRYQNFLTLHPLSPLASDAWFKSALSLYRLGRWEDALATFKTAGSRFPQAPFIPDLPLWSGLCLLDSGRSQEALVLFQNTLDGSPPDRLRLPLLLHLARAQTALELWPEAAQSLKTLALAEADAFFANEFETVLLANALSHMGAWEELGRVVEKTAGRTYSNANREMMDFWKAESLRAAGRTEEAIPAYEKLETASLPIASMAYQRLFNFDLEKGDYKKLTALLSRAELRLAERLDILQEFWVRIGILTYKNEQYELSEIYFRKVWVLFPQTAIPGTTPLYLSLLHQRKNEPNEAIALIDRYLQISRDEEALLLSQKGRLLVSLRRWGQAAAVFADLSHRFQAHPLSDQWRLNGSLAQSKNRPDATALIRVNEAIAFNRTPEFTAFLLKIKAVLEKSLGNNQAALETWAAYLPLAPEDDQARLQAIELKFQSKNHAQVLQDIESWTALRPNLKKDHPREYFKALAMKGLSLLGLKRHEEAKSTLDLVANSIDFPGKNELLPYVEFYRGWSLLHLAVPDFAAAAQILSKSAQSFPDSLLHSKTLYWAGLSALNAHQFPLAESLFRSLSLLSPQTTESVGAPLHLARALAAQGRIPEARKVYQDVVRQNPQTTLAPEAAFEAAKLWEQEGDIKAAAEAFLQLNKQFPTSVFAEESLYHRGDLFFGSKQWELAREAFSDYRRTYPKGRWTDGALYWAGESALLLNEPFGAVLLWLNLVDNHPKSSFRLPALRKTADVYFQAGDYKEAQKHLRNLLATAPTQAKALGVQERLDQIELILKGQTEEEAKLLVTINKENRTKTLAGRQALSNLARLYLFEDGRRLEESRSLLLEILSGPQDDADILAKAQYDLGEYWYRQGQLVKAGEEFLKVRQFKPNDKDIIASSLFRAAEMIYLAGNRSQSAQIVQALEKTFPNSDWVIEGKRLLGETP